MPRFILKNVLWVLCLSVVAVSVNAQTQLTLEQTISLAQEHDPWLDGSRYQEEAALAQSIASGSLPDPTVSVGFANLPTNSFDFGQEPMTQFQIGISQMFPRGETRSLKRQQMRELAGQHPLMREDREAKVKAMVSQLWLEVFRNQQSIHLIEKDRELFEHLVDVAESSYTSAVGKTQQQDLVRAQLELTRLEDRLTVLHQQQEMNLAKLGEWLPGDIANMVLGESLPTLTLNTSVSSKEKPGQIAQWLLAHPGITALDQQITASNTGIDLARQKYKPQWGLNARYGYRDDDPLGIDRSDFFSLGISFDVPLFTANRQDQELQAAQSNSEATKTEKALALRSMLARFDAAQTRLKRLSERKVLYEDRLLKEIHDQAEASLTAYTNDTGDFAEVVRARIAELNANIDYLDIKINRLKTIAELNYFLTSATVEDSGGL